MNPKWLHIIPENDIEEHDESMECKCNPKQDWDNWIILHNSFDGREIFEEIQQYFDSEDRFNGC